MNKLNKSAIAAIVTSSLLLSGCGAMAYKEQKEKADKVGGQITKMTNAHKELYISAPPVDLNPIKLNKPKVWSDRIPVQINTTEVGLDNVLRDISRRAKVSVFYGRETNKNIPVKINVNGTLSDLARNIESQTDYKVDLSLEGTLSILAWETETYSLANLVGKHDFMIGKQAAADLTDGEDSDAESSSGSLFNADQDQYSSIKADDASPIEDTVDAIESIIGKEELRAGAGVKANKASGTVTVSARPRTMRKINKYVVSMNSIYGKQVNIKVRILTFQTTKNNSFGIDWNLVRKTTDGALNFASTASGGVVNSLDNLGAFSYTASSGNFDGTSILINALQEQGNVAITTEPSLLVTNNRVGEIERLRKEAYVKDVTIPTIDSDSNNEYAEVSQGIVSEGFSMRILPKIMDNEVIMQLSATVSKLGDFGVVDMPNIQIKTPNISEERFNQSIRVQDGRTVVLSGYSQGTTSSGEKQSFENPALGGNSGRDQTSQTIVLLTPTIVK